MSCPEMVQLGRKTIINLYEMWFLTAKDSPKEIINSSKRILFEIDYSNVILPEKIKIFKNELDFLAPINWHLDINSGLEFPRRYSKTLNIYDPKFGSAKYIWEINRMQFLPLLCIKFQQTGDYVFLKILISHIVSWKIQNPYLIGINWYSNIEINIRLITWFICWEILDADNLALKDPEFQKFVQNDWLPLIKDHCVYSYKNPSKFSSANNHLISEYSGLFIASSKWPFKDSEKWLRYSQSGLENEIISQHSKNGINKEEAAEYIQFITDFFLMAFVVGENTNRPFSIEFKKRLFEIFSYICEFLDCKGNFPKYGDEDDGKCFIIDFDLTFNNFRSLLTSGAIIFNNSILKSRSNGFDTKNKLLFGEKSEAVYEDIPEHIANASSKFYPDEGHFLLKKVEEGKEIYFHFDSAPLGYLSIAAHGHADALSFIMHLDGHPIFIDPGTYTYHTERDWRNYFKGTLAHNTIRINKKDQALNRGPTLWLDHFKSSLIAWSSDNQFDIVEAMHNGYIKEGAKHIRKIVFDKSKNEFLIQDTIDVNGERNLSIEIPFHFHPFVKINRSSKNRYLISTEDTRKIEFYIDEQLDPVMINGQIKPSILGWFSNSFMEKEPANVIYCMTQIKNSSTFKYVIKIY